MQLKTELLNHNVHTKQPLSAEGIDEWRATTHTLRCVILSASGLSAKKGNQVQHVVCLTCILTKVLQSRTIGVSFELFFSDFYIQTLGLTHKTILVMKHDFVFLNKFCAKNFLRLYIFSDLCSRSLLKWMQGYLFT